jgi:hypothetical protein
MDSVVTTGTITTGSRYGNTGLAGMPTAGVDQYNNIYLAYSGYREDTDDGNGHKYRNIYMTASTDNGASWTFPPVNVTNDDFSEGVYPSMARDVDNTPSEQCAHVVWHWDDAVGTLANATTPAYNPNNQVKYNCMTPTELSVGVKNISVPAKTESVAVYPNPVSSSDNIIVRYSLSKSAKVEIDVVNITGQQVYHQVQNLNAGGQVVQIPATTLSKGVYYVNSKINGAVYTNKLVIE